MRESTKNPRRKSGNPSSALHCNNSTVQCSRPQNVRINQVRLNWSLRANHLSEVPTDTRFPADIFKLDSGLTVIHQHTPATPVAVVDVWVRAGATREPDAWSGMAHFLEHMIFKGTDKIPPVKV